MSLIERFLHREAPHPEYMKAVREVVRDPRIIEAFEKVPRERFIRYFRDLVPRFFWNSQEELRHYFRIDDAVQLAIPGSSISQPSLIGMTLSTAQIAQTDKVLEIGSGSGYLLALASLLGQEVYGVEINEELVKRSRAALHQMRLLNAGIILGDGGTGFPEEAPFDVIIVSAGLYEKVPHELEDQLAEGGRVVAFVGELQTYLKMMRGTRVADHVIYDVLENGIFAFHGLKGTHGFSEERRNNSEGLLYRLI